MQPIFATVGPLTAADANGICEAQTPLAGPLTLDGVLVTTVTTGNTYGGTPITVTSAILDRYQVRMHDPVTNPRDRLEPHLTIGRHIGTVFDLHHPVSEFNTES